MALDLEQISIQIEGMASELRELSRRRADQIADGLRIMGDQEQQIDRLKSKLAESKGKTTWLVAGLKQSLASVHRAPPIPSDYAAVGADGSQIGVDRHHPAQCCLINIGTCLLQYGDRWDARLDSKPFLYFRDEDLFLDNPENPADRQRLEGPLFSAKREIVATRHMVDLVKSTGLETPLLALLDASLIMWPLAGQRIPEFVRDRLLIREFLPCLDELRATNASRQVALASYVSAPRYTDVVNVLRIGICPFEPIDCNRSCTPPKGKQCGQVDGLRDRDLFALLLPEAGMRSDVFVSLSSIVQGYYREHEVHFFYINVGSEIARVEIPRWVAEDPALLDLTHSLTLDQVLRGHGYPVALTEAHERAVVTGADRENFWLLLETELDQRRLNGHISEKSLSKNLRGI